MYKIEKNIPVPAARSRVTKYPFDKMDVGDSFLIVKQDGEEHEKIRMKAVGAACGYAKTKGWKFRTRKEGENLRVWRIA